MLFVSGLLAMAGSGAAAVRITTRMMTEAKKPGDAGPHE
jgi:hypothetical protein